jgi:hypothetical protein
MEFERDLGLESNSTTDADYALESNSKPKMLKNTTTDRNTKTRFCKPNKKAKIKIHKKLPRLIFTSTLFVGLISCFAMGLISTSTLLLPRKN